MADLTKHFLKFNKKISLTASDVKFLRAARNKVVTRIKNHFSDYLNQPTPKFIGQGSFSMKTIVKPHSGAYDIDVGVYLQGQSRYRADWPKPETVSNWLKKALKNHTSIKPIDKKTCLRIIYKPKQRGSAIYYHVDLPIYIEYENLWGNKKTRIGQNGEKCWEEKSDPKGFTSWVTKACQRNKIDKSQFIRIVKYLKAWKDNHKKKGKMPNGMLLTVLAGENFIHNERDDISFYKTIKNISRQLNASHYIEKPVEPHNDLGDYLTHEQWKKFKKKLDILIEDMKQAINSNDIKDSIAMLSKQFDDRFNKIRK